MGFTSPEALFLARLLDEAKKLNQQQAETNRLLRKLAGEPPPKPGRW
jgi:hypothetical protein